MSSGDFNFHNADVKLDGGSQLNQGQTVNAEINNSRGAPLTLEALFDKIAEGLPEMERPQLRAEVVEPLKTLAQDKEHPTSQERKFERTEHWTLLDRLKPYAPSIMRAISVFGAAALSALASRNPIVAGVLAVLKMDREPGDSTD
jgi:hypothetical protein